jgi:hypothetical protein
MLPGRHREAKRTVLGQLWKFSRLICGLDLAEALGAYAEALPQECPRTLYYAWIGGLGVKGLRFLRNDS